MREHRISENGRRGGTCTRLDQLASPAYCQTMKSWFRLGHVPFLVAAGILTASCGGGDASDSTANTVESTVSTSFQGITATTTPPPTAAEEVPATSPPTAVRAATGRIPNVVGLDLQHAQDTLQAAGFYVLSSHDATGQRRNQVLDRNWQVCDQTPPGGTAASSDTAIDLGAVKDEESCP